MVKLNNYITLNSGRKFYFDDIRRNKIFITDIANGLATTPRFGGQMDIDKWYSIAEHSINVSKLVPRKHAFCALMHDATEGIATGDVVTPLKVKLPDFKSIEAEIDAFIAEYYGYDYPFPDIVKQVDFNMFITEYNVVFQNRNKQFEGEEDRDDFESMTPPYLNQIDFKFYNPREAYDAFLERYVELGGR